MARSTRTADRGPLDPLDRLADLADSLAGAWSARALASTSVGRERAILRLAGVHGLDRDDRPLAWAVVDRYLSAVPDRLGGGVLMPFAMALAEYDVAPQELALDVASGAIDLGLEAELLREPGRRALAEAGAADLAALALERTDANRTARRELVDVLGDAPWPWIGASIREPVARDAAGEALGLVRAGADVVRVSVPAGRELAERLTDAGVTVHRWSPGERYERAPMDEDVAPAGSQRGLALLRATLDEAAAGRRGYVRIATSAPALAAPEQAVVAAFERIDMIEADPMAEIVGARVDPERALTDHAFAHRLLRRAGTLLLVGSGPLVVAPDLARGLPSGPDVLAGRGLALQALAVALARQDGLAREQVVVGALPPWLFGDRGAGAQALAGVELRRALFRGHPLAFEEPVLDGPAAAAWPFVLAAALPRAGATALVLRRSGPAGILDAAAAARAAASVAIEVAASEPASPLAGPALEHARGAVTAAIETLERLRAEGWPAVLGAPLGGPSRSRLGADAVAERTEPFAPFDDRAPPATRR